MHLALVSRFSLAVLLAAVCNGLYAQDAAQMQIAQQAAQMQQQQMQQQAQQQAIQQQQQAVQQANQAGSLSPARTPKFSVKAGPYTGPVTVKIQAPSRGSVIYYTTDGWTPTQASHLYHGPIRITQTTTLQAIAVSPYYARSAVKSALYSLPGVSAAAEPEPATTDAGSSLLRKGTAVPLVFAAAVTSKDVKVGDHLPVVLAEDLRVGRIVIAPKGTQAVASVFQVDKPGIQGFPGVIQFDVESLQLANGVTVPLKGFEKKEGTSSQKKAGLLDVVPAGGAFVRGGDAVIEQGARLTAHVAADTPVDGNQTKASNN
jgi:high-affinity Fe2+/Pb2+ permease